MMYICGLNQSSMPDSGNIIIKGAKVNNLKNITVEIPRNKFTVVTGISGSGKSSLAFDTLFAEGQRRFAESLSSYARQFLGRMSKPDVEAIEGIPPAIAIEQKVNTRNPRYRGYHDGNLRLSPAYIRQNRADVFSDKRCGGKVS